MAIFAQYRAKTHIFCVLFVKIPHTQQSLFRFNL